MSLIIIIIIIIISTALRPFFPVNDVHRFRV